MVVSPGRMKERSRFLAADGFNVQLKKPPATSVEIATLGGRDGVRSASLDSKEFRSDFGFRNYGFDSFSCSGTANRKTVEARSIASKSRVTAEPTTYQKVRRIIEEHNERQSRSSPRRNVDSPCLHYKTPSKTRELINYSIVASSRGENARNIRDGRSTGFSSFSVCETIAPAAARYAPRKITAGGANGRRRKSGVRCQEEGFQKSRNKSSKLPSVAEPNRRARQTGVKVTLSQTREFRELPWGSEGKPEGKDGYFANQQRKLLAKLPSSFLSEDGRDRQRIKTAQVFDNSQENGSATGLHRSPSTTTLPSSWKKPARVGVKKSVSFSSDTSFQEKKSLFASRTAHVHEAKVYYKGVLQDRPSQSLENLRDVVVTPRPTSSTYTTPTTKTTTPIMTPGGSLALVRAAREGNNSTIRQMMARMKTPLGKRELNINTVDASGRTAISYLAGNGTVAMLEAALCFPEVDVNLADNEGNTPLHFAAQAGQLECVSILLQRSAGIEVDARNTLGFTPLMKAALQGRTKCAKILLFAGANPTLRDYGRGLRAEQWARFCGRYVCAEVIERFARHRLLERTTSCRWGSEPELAARVLQGKVTPMPTNVPPQSTGLRSKIRRVFRTSSGPDNRSFSLVSQLTSAALCASSPALPRPGDVPPVVKSLIRPLSVPQLSRGIGRIVTKRGLQ
ncbi:uncharacterized protein LOC105692384 isoform X2 [Athalia rosae]|uniref:uncharacterized protein LOC105692384 isoform X2 n=1 Tax=Athalia rosae TaxID=37344 RepID=UPI0020344DB7|nr:uncharacterized protein LOC105692384 isoform X2 [Athalia rosae]